MMKQRLQKMIRDNPYWGGIVFDKAQQALKGATPTVEQLDEAERQLIRHMTTKKRKPIMVNKGDDIESRLLTINENLLRYDLTVLEQAQHITKREEILEELGKRAKSKEFTKLPNDILFAPTISPSTKTLYALLVSYARDKSYCQPSHSRLATDLGVSTKSIGRWLDELTSHGLITTKRRGLTNKIPWSNVYYLAKYERKEG